EGSLLVLGGRPLGMPGHLSPPDSSALIAAVCRPILRGAAPARDGGGSAGSVRGPGRTGRRVLLAHHGGGQGADQPAVGGDALEQLALAAAGLGGRLPEQHAV